MKITNNSTSKMNENENKMQDLIHNHVWKTSPVLDKITYYTNWMVDILSHRGLISIYKYHVILYKMCDDIEI